MDNIRGMYEWVRLLLPNFPVQLFLHQGLICIRNSSIGAGKDVKFHVDMNQPNQVIHCFVGCENIGMRAFNY